MEKLKFERPIIVRVNHAMSSKYGSSIERFIEVKNTIDGNNIDELVNEFGAPLFVYSQEKIKNLYQRAHKAFSDNYPDVQFSWSYKTNYLKSICATFHELGSIAEVVSEFEYEKARNLGVEGKDIVYNGPTKPDQSIELAIKEKAKIHIDNFQEIFQISKIAKELNLTAIVGMRINLNTGVYPQWSRFGFNYETGEFEAALDKVMKLANLDLRGIHTHIGTFMMDPRPYEVATSKMCEIFLKIKNKYGHKLEYIDLGGGFPSKSHLKGVYQAPEVAIKDVEDYASAICNTIKNKIPTEDLPKLFLETGRHLIDEAGYLVTQVQTSKVMPDGKRSYVMDAGVNLLYTSTWFNYKLYATNEVKGICEPAVLNGPLCMNIDIIEDNLSLPFIKSGTNMLLYPVGAYNVTQSMQFIKYRPAIVMVDYNQKAHIIKNKENLQSVEQDELLMNTIKKIG